MSGSLISQDQLFITSTSQDDISEITDGQLAQARSGSLAVSIFGGQLVADHGFITLETSLARDRSGTVLSTTPDPTQAQQTAQLQGLTGTAFDQQYLADEAQANQTSIIEDQQELASGQDPSVQDLASLVLPFQEVHAVQAQLLQLSANVVTAQPTTSGGVALVPDQPPNAHDRAYVDQVGQSSNDEIRLGQLAEQQTSTEAVGVFGRWMVLDHTALNSVLAYVGSDFGIMPPATLSGSGMAAAATLQTLTGAAFDQQYLFFFFD